MKINSKVFAATSVAALGTAAVALANYNKAKKAKAVLPEGFTITAHTGCEGTKDNSLDSILKGCKCGADIVEFDLNFDLEGKPVLSHDVPKGKCPTLDEAFECVAKCENLKVNVDVKTTTDLKAVVESAEKNGVSERIFYTGIGEREVEAVKQQTPEISYFLNMPVDKLKKNKKSYLSQLADTVENSGAIGINLNFRGCSKQLVELFRERGLLVSVWTVNNKYNMFKVLEMAPDNITTRFPSVLKDVIEG